MRSQRMFLRLPLLWPWPPSTSQHFILASCVESGPSGHQWLACNCSHELRSQCSGWLLSHSQKKYSRTMSCQEAVGRRGLWRLPTFFSLFFWVNSTLASKYGHMTGSSWRNVMCSFPELSYTVLSYVASHTISPVDDIPRHPPCYFDRHNLKIVHIL